MGNIMKIIIFAFCGIATLIGGFCPALADNADFKTAVIDVGQVLNSSTDIRNAEKEHLEQINNLLISIKEQSDKRTLDEKYKKELVEKKQEIDKNYYDKITEIDKDLSKKVEMLAKEYNYDLIIAKDAVLYSKNDLTTNLIKKIKSSK